MAATSASESSFSRKSYINSEAVRQKFEIASKSSFFSLNCVGIEAMIYAYLELDRPLPAIPDELLHTRFCKPEDSIFLSGKTEATIVFNVDGYDVHEDLSYDDLYKCLSLMELIDFKAGNPDKTISPQQRDKLYTQAYYWILNKVNATNTDPAIAIPFRNFVLSFTGFSSIKYMREFIDIYYIPVELIGNEYDSIVYAGDETQYSIPRDTEFGLNLILNDGFRASSPSITQFFVCNFTRLTRCIKNFGHARSSTFYSNLHSLISEMHPDNTDACFSLPFYE